MREAYASKLAAGWCVCHNPARFQGTIHDFVMLNALENSARRIKTSPWPAAGCGRDFNS
jgi:hypothetical protein